MYYMYPQVMAHRQGGKGVHTDDRGRCAVVAARPDSLKLRVHYFPVVSSPTSILHQR